MENRNSEETVSAFRFVNANTAVRNAFNAVKIGQTGVQNFLKTLWHGVNRLCDGGFRFGDIVLLAGSSGAGKSYFLNMLIWTFFSEKYNKEFHKPFKILYFSFEMSAAAEMLRTMSTKTGLPYYKIIGGMDPNEANEVRAKLTPIELARLEKVGLSLAHEDLYYVEDALSPKQMTSAIAQFKKQFPNHKIVVACDHSLLVEYPPGVNSENELLSVLAKEMQRWKSYDILTLMIWQLNDKIEEPHRVDNPAQHFPRKGDLFGSKKGYQAADYVIVLHSPETLGIEFYGRKRHPTENLLAVHFLKRRNGAVGYTLLQKQFDKGMLVQQPKTT
jgi:replicative DNA helicase